MPSIKHILTKVKNTLPLREVLTFVLFLVLASCLWWMYALRSVRERTIEIPIQYSGIPQNVGFSDELPTSVNITICDAGSRLRYYTSHHFGHISIDISKQLQGRSGTVSITSESFRSQINDHLQGTSKLLKISPDLFETHYFVQASKTVPVVLNGNITPANQFLILGDPILTPSQITIYGEKTLLDSISSISTEEINLSNVKDSVRIDITPIFPKGVRSNEQSVSTLIIAEQYTEKVFVKTIQPKGVPSGATMKLFPATAQVTARVSLSHFNDINGHDIHVSAHYPKSTEQAKVELEATSKNPYILNLRVSPSAVEYLIEK